MRKTFVLFGLMLLLASAGLAQKKMIVNDYFLSIPSEYIKIDRVQRAKWISEDDAAFGFLEFTVPFGEDEDWGGAEVWGQVQLFPMKGNKTLVAMILNRCLESVCEGNLLLLEYNAGRWTNVTETLAPKVESSEIAAVLKDSPAYERPIIKDEEIPLALSFQRQDKLIQFFAACTSPGCDGAVIPKSFKWNGTAFESFEYEVSP